MLSAYQPNATARNRIRLTSGFDTRDANGNSRVFETAIVGGSNAPVASADSVVVTTRSDYELGASGNLLVLHTVDNFGRDEREYHHAFGFIDKLGNRTLFVRDMLGSVRAVLKNGTMVEWNDYYAYGAARDSWSLANGRWKYLGAEADNETGTLHLDAREHDGWVGRLWQVDPLWRLYPHQSPYIYGNANPFRFRDRNGMSSDTLTVEAEEIVVTAERGDDEAPTTVDYILNHPSVRGSSVWQSSNGMWYRLNSGVFNDPFGVSTTPLMTLKNIPQMLNLLRGSGPVSGVIEVSKNVKSLKAFNNFNPTEPIEFVFDAATERFVVGKVNSSVGWVGSPHEQLAQSIGATGNSVVGGMFKRGVAGEIIINEQSGHYWMNWTPQIRDQIVKFLESTTGLRVVK